SSSNAAPRQAPVHQYLGEKSAISIKRKTATKYYNYVNENMTSLNRKLTQTNNSNEMRTTGDISNLRKFINKEIKEKFETKHKNDPDNNNTDKKISQDYQDEEDEYHTYDSVLLPNNKN
ncbi:MAG: hypothetical protein MHPSP_001930, partial [Paramarteilia canceri]